MKRLLNYCKTYNLDNEYRNIRTFLSKEENAVITRFTLWQFKQKFKDQQLLFLSSYFMKKYTRLMNIKFAQIVIGPWNG